MRISVICIGNVLLMDEGVGPACARYMRSRYRFPDNVEVLDRACMGMAIISDLRDCDFALVLDAVEVPEARPGQIFSFEPDDVAPTEAGMMSLHDVRFADVLASASFLGIRCEGHCFGVQVENMSPSEFVEALTPRVAAALPLLAQSAVRYLRESFGLQIDDLLATGEAELDLPCVYGRPDVTVLAEYLAKGLAAVGACGKLVADLPGAVDLALPGGWPQNLCVPERLGFEPCARAGEYRVAVNAGTTDVDCDVFIGMCKELVG